MKTKYTSLLSFLLTAFSMAIVLAHTLMPGPVAAASGLGQAQRQKIELKVPVEVAITFLNIACVERGETEAEGEESKLFYDAESYQRVSELKKQGFGSVYLSSASCERGLSTVKVAADASAAEVGKAVLAAGGFKRTKVIFYDWSRQRRAHEKALKEILGSLK